MKKKVLFTALGKGKQKDNHKKYQYDYALYRIDDYVYFSKYIFEALIEQMYDEMVFIGTSGSDWAALHLYVCEELSLIKNKEREIDLDELEENEKLEELVRLEKTDEGYINEVLSEKLSELIRYRMSHYLSSDLDNPKISNFSIQFKLVPDGENDKEIKDVLDEFLKMTERVLFQKTNFDITDEFMIDLDITHSYRSLPMFYYSMLNYMIASNTHLKIVLRTVFYGMYEKTDFKKSILKDQYEMLLNLFIEETERYKSVRIMNSQTVIERFINQYPNFNNRKFETVIVRLNQLVEIDNWVKATNDFVHFGYVQGLKNLIDFYVGNSRLAGNLIKKYKELGNALENISRKLGVVNVVGIRNDIQNLETSLKSLKKVDPNIFINSTIEILSVFLQDLSEVNEILFDYEKGLTRNTIIAYNCCKWYLDHGKLASFIVCSLETFITFMMEIFGYRDEDVKEYYKRDHFKSQLTTNKLSSLKNREEYDRLNIMDKVNYFINSLSSIRNAVAHSSMGGKNIPYQNLKIIFNIQSFDKRMYEERKIMYEMTVLMKKMIDYAENKEGKGNKVSKLFFANDKNLVKTLSQLPKENFILNS